MEMFTSTYIRLFQIVTLDRSDIMDVTDTTTMADITAAVTAIRAWVTQVALDIRVWAILAWVTLATVSRDPVVKNLNIAMLSIFSKPLH